MNLRVPKTFRAFLGYLKTLASPECSMQIAGIYSEAPPVVQTVL
jgi:hypothetical protein